MWRPSHHQDTSLAGITVLEIGAFMAAPFGTMQLADLGADVIKIENPAGGDPVRATGPFLDEDSSPFLRLNRNKRSLALDLKSEAGVEVLRDLLRTADVLVENLRPGTLARLGFGYDEVHELNPRLVYVSASGWGQDGPLAALPGLDIMAQARAGLMSVTGPPSGEPAKVGVPICDLVCGLYVALGALAALRARETTGEGQHVDVSLYESGVSFAIWEAGKYWATGEVGQPLGSAHQSTAPYQAVRTSDGWVTVGAVTTKTWRGFCDALDLGDLHDDPRYVDAFTRHGHRDTLIPAIEESTTRRTTAEVVELLDAAGVPCAPIADMGQVFTDDHLTTRGFFWDAPHPRHGSVRQIGSPMRLGGTPVVQGASGPDLGGDTRDVLAECGYDDDAIERLLADGVVATDVPAPAGAGSPVPDPD
ncbi:CaiB/BaiF CoA transferase family protein [Nocardioides euryhalodurans]|uniref:CoA transferase n=1 Tax=Nocardioides euryhalodurans TaxID=2518370 RepID=A0A4P7GLK3_9ACTN|nr:CaiB/BaiF CoA-transferase family protein [Nocardioides euryhalodurans]QBR92843.1 CoA transferase [Nocardioides euryhalodurans]